MESINVTHSGTPGAVRCRSLVKSYGAGATQDQTGQDRRLFQARAA